MMRASSASENPGGGPAVLAPVSAGFVCVLVGFTSSYAIVVTASGMTLAGIGSAFWAVLLGLALRLILRGWR